jgi:diadenosine tetraphosphate (Ap4A) HIT family hydrolase
MKCFDEVPHDRRIHESKYFYVIKDGFPVSPGHSLIISKDLKETFFDLSADEKKELVELIDVVKGIIENEHAPDGFNIGMNCGVAAGQSVMHFHCHVIPRYKGDMVNPKGGVRYCIMLLMDFIVCRVFISLVMVRLTEKKYILKHTLPVLNEDSIF